MGFPPVRISSGLIALVAEGFPEHGLPEERTFFGIERKQRNYPEEVIQGMIWVVDFSKTACSTT